MEMRVLAIGLALGLAGLLAGVGCGPQDATQQDAGQQVGVVLEKEAETARAAAERATEAIDQGARALAAKAERKQGPETIVEDGAEGAVIRLEYAGKAAKDAYDKARSRARGEFDSEREPVEEE